MYEEDFVRQGRMLDGQVTLRITGLANLSIHVEGIRQKANNLSPFWAAAEGAFFKSEQAVWARQGWPEPWPPLSMATRAQKRGPGILRETDRMYRSVTSHTGDTVYEYSARNVMFGTHVEYARYHMTGTSRMPARPFIAMVPEVWNALNIALLRWLLDASTPPGQAPRGQMPV